MMGFYLQSTGSSFTSLIKSVHFKNAVLTKRLLKIILAFKYVLTKNIDIWNPLQSGIWEIKQHNISTLLFFVIEFLLAFCLMLLSDRYIDQKD